MTGSSRDAGPANPVEERDPSRRRFLGQLGGLALAATLGPLWKPARAGSAAPALAGDARETARCWRAMGTLIEVRVPDLPPSAAVAALRSVRQRVEELEASMTLFRPESPLLAVNRAAPGTWNDVPEALGRALQRAATASLESNGAYDPTVTPAMRAWGLYEGTGDGRPPDDRWFHRAGPAALEVRHDFRRVRRHDRATEFDLGGIGKGIAVDEALVELARAGSRSALVNLGGSIGVLGAPPHSPRGWPVGIAHPDLPGAIWASGWLARGHLATSGDYERWVETPRGRKHHLIDPRTGEPAPGVASVTVWGERGWETDVASTTLFMRHARGEAAGDAPHLALLRRGSDLVNVASFGSRCGRTGFRIEESA